MNTISGGFGSPLTEAVDALGEILAAQSESMAVVVVGGTAMIVQGFVERATSDVDIIAIARDTNAGRQRTIELWLGLADRHDLILMKLYAAADSQGPSSVHYQDLLALEPTHDELDAAAVWVRTQDVSPEFSSILDQVVEQGKTDV